MRRARTSVCFALAAGCGGAVTAVPSEPVAPPPPEPSSIGWLAPPPSASASASAIASAAASTPRALPAACRGDHLDLAALAEGDGCRAPAGAAPLESSLTVTVASTDARVKAGESVSLRVVVRNVSGAPLALWFDTAVSPWGARSNGFSLDLGSGFGTTKRPRPKGPTAPRVPARTAPETPTLTRFDVSATDARGQSTEYPEVFFGILGVLSAAAMPVEVELAPGGDIVAPVEWRATGYLPASRFVAAKPKNPNEGVMIPPPVPLPRGRYTLAISVPLVGLPSRGTTTIEVTGP